MPFSVSVFGKVGKIGENFTGECETTKDILGPFYRPNAPMRQDLMFDGLAGVQIEVKGQVFKSDCVSPLKNALVEIWHCDTTGTYDKTEKFFSSR